jgi:hypothetical protein
MREIPGYSPDSANENVNVEIDSLHELNSLNEEGLVILPNTLDSEQPQQDPSFFKTVALSYRNIVDNSRSFLEKFTANARAHAKHVAVPALVAITLTNAACNGPEDSAGNFEGSRQDSTSTTATEAPNWKTPTITYDTPTAAPATPTQEATNTPTVEPTVGDTATPTLEATIPPTLEPTVPETPEAPQQVDFGELSPEQKREEVRKNIDTFMNIPITNLHEVGEKSQLEIKFYNDNVPTPLIRLGDETVPSWRILDPNHPDKGMKNISIIGALDDIENESGYANIFDFNGIYLGRTEHLMQTEIGEVMVQIGYFGSYIEDTRVVMPYFLGWVGESDDTSSPAAYLERNAPDENQENPLVNDSTASRKSLPEVLDRLDANIGSAVVQLQINAQQIPNVGFPDKARSKGFPPEFYDPNKIIENYRMSKEIYDDFIQLIFREASENGYVLGSFDQPGGFPVPENLITSESTEEILANLPNPAQMLDTEYITTDEIYKILRPLSYKVVVSDSSVFDTYEGK